MQEIRVYRIYDERNSCYWKSWSGQGVWIYADDAKMAWEAEHNLHTPISTHYMHFNHSKQQRYIIHQFEIHRLIQEMTNGQK